MLSVGANFANPSTTKLITPGNGPCSRRFSIKSTPAMQGQIRCRFVKLSCAGFLASIGQHLRAHNSSCEAFGILEDEVDVELILWHERSLNILDYCERVAHGTSFYKESFLVDVDQSSVRRDLVQEHSR